MAHETKKLPDNIPLCEHDDWIISGAQPDTKKCDTCGMVYHMNPHLTHTWQNWNLCHVCKAPTEKVSHYEPLI